MKISVLTRSSSIAILFFLSTYFFSPHSTFADTTNADKKTTNIAAPSNEQIKKDLKILHKADQSGLLQVLKTFCADGGKFTLQDNGAIQITPSDSSLIKKLLATEKKPPEEYSPAKSLALPLTQPVSNTTLLDSTNTELLMRLKEANDQGLAGLLNKLSAEGGELSFEEDGAIKIIPENKTLTKKLLSQVSKIQSSRQKTEESTQIMDETKPHTNNVSIPSNVPTSIIKDIPVDDTHLTVDSILANHSGSTDTSNASAPALSDDNKELLIRLQDANNSGLSTLLKTLTTNGGKFELIEKGGIKIVPTNNKKAKKLFALLNEKKEIKDTVKTKKVKETVTHYSKKPPINTWAKAKSLATTWIEQENKSDVTVGKIRKFKWLYLISILQKNNTKMDTQLIIRIKDGKIIAINPNEFEIFNLNSNQ